MSAESAVVRFLIGDRSAPSHEPAITPSGHRTRRSLRWLSSLVIIGAAITIGASGAYGLYGPSDPEPQQAWVATNVVRIPEGMSCSSQTGPRPDSRLCVRQTGQGRETVYQPNALTYSLHPKDGTRNLSYPEKAELSRQATPVPRPKFQEMYPYPPDAAGVQVESSAGTYFLVPR